MNQENKPATVESLNKEIERLRARLKEANVEIETAATSYRAITDAVHLLALERNAFGDFTLRVSREYRLAEKPERYRKEAEELIAQFERTPFDFIPLPKPSSENAKLRDELTKLALKLRNCTCGKKGKK